MAGVDDAGSRIAPITPFGDLQGILDLVKGVTGTSNNSSTTQNLGPEAQGALQLFLQHFLPTLNNDYSPEAAKRDSEGLVKQIFDTYKTGDLPRIYSAEKNSGGYNSTTGQGLADNAFAQAVAKSAEVTQKTTDNYAQRQQSQMNSLLQLVLGLGAVTKQTNTTGTQGGLSNDALKKAAAAAALAAAAKGGNKSPPSGGGGGGAGKPKDDSPSQELQKQLQDAEDAAKERTDSDAERMLQDSADTISGGLDIKINDPSDPSSSDISPDTFAQLPSDLLDATDGAGDIGGFDDFNFSDIFGDDGNPDDSIIYDFDPENLGGGGGDSGPFVFGEED